MTIEEIRAEGKRLLAKNKKAGQMYLCRNDLRYLCVEVLGFVDWDIIHDQLQDFLISHQESAKLIMIPRGHLKSSIVTVGWVIQQILNNFDIRILICNAVWQNARNFTRQIKQLMTDKSKLSEIFGEFRSRDWNRDSFIIKQRKKALPAPTVTTAGVGSSLTSQHYDLIIHDDIVAPGNYETPELRDKVKAFYRDSLNLVEHDNSMVVVGTTWCADDLYSELRNSEYFVKFIRKVRDHVNGKIDFIYPKKFNLHVIERLKAQLGPILYSSQYELNPYPEEEIQFKKSWIQYYDSLPVEAMYVATVLDPSVGRTKRSDYAAITTTGITSDGRVYILEARRFKCDVSLLPSEVLRTVQKWTPNIIGVEAFAMQRVLIDPIRTKLEACGITTFIDALTTDTRMDKTQRILQLIPKFSNGLVYLRRDMKDLEEELRRFSPKLKNNQDDIIDSLAWHPMTYWMRKPDEIRQEQTKPYSLNWWMNKKGTMGGTLAERFFADMAKPPNKQVSWVR